MIERDVQRDDIRLVEQLVERHRRHVVRPIKLVVVTNVVCQHAAVKWRQELDQILSDKSAADDPEGAAGELASHPFPELALSQGEVRFGHAMQ